MSVTAALAFSIEISGHWGLIICGIPGGPQVVKIFSSGRKMIYINISSQGNFLQMSPFYFLVAIRKLFHVS